MFNALTHHTPYPPPTPGGSRIRGIATQANSRLKGISNRTLVMAQSFQDPETTHHTPSSSHTSVYSSSTRTSFSGDGVSVSSVTTEVPLHAHTQKHTSTHTPSHTQSPTHSPSHTDVVYGSDPHIHIPMSPILEEDIHTQLKRPTSFPTHIQPSHTNTHTHNSTPSSLLPPLHTHAHQHT
ncbi:hypothetical protein EON63_23370, partial [archaeon]